jgi:hypothetical protein
MPRRDTVKLIKTRYVHTSEIGIDEALAQDDKALI